MGVRLLVPEKNEQELDRLGRALRRSICAGVMDKTATDDEIRHELRAILEGYRSHTGQKWERSDSLSVRSTM